MSVSEIIALEKCLLEYGKNLLDPSSLEMLLQLVDKLFLCLSEVKQDPPISVTNALSPLKDALVAPRLFEHSDVHVEVSVAGCITQIMRITVPNAPYDDDEKMKEVLQLIVSSFEHLSDMCSSISYAKSIEILETVSKLNMSIVMLDLGCDALVIEMFQHFLKSLRDHHPMKIFLYMENIMTFVLEESDDVPPELLSPILHYVKKDNKVPQVSRRLAEQVLINCPRKLDTYLTEAVKSSGVSLDMYSNVVASICRIHEVVQLPVAEDNGNRQNPQDNEIKSRVKIMGIDKILKTMRSSLE